MTDSGALLTTCAGAGATIVAIVGGLLVARYVTVDSEQDGAHRRLLAVRDQAADAAEDLRVASRKLDELRVVDAFDDSDVRNIFIARHIERNTHKRGAGPPPGPLPDLVTLDDLSGALDDGFVDALGPDAGPAVSSRVDAMNAQAAEAVAALLPLAWAMADHRQLADWVTIRAQLNELYDHDDEELWWQAWCDIADMVEEQRDPPTSAFGMGLPTFRPERLRPFGLRRVSRRDERSRLRRLCDEAQAQKSKLDAEAEIAERDWQLIGNPRGLRSGLLVLAYLTVVSVVVPVLLLAPTPATLSTVASVWVVAAFLSGLLVLFGYLGWYAYRLRPR